MYSTVKIEMMKYSEYCKKSVVLLERSGNVSMEKVIIEYKMSMLIKILVNLLSKI
jgi:hypothetical protein